MEAAHPIQPSQGLHAERRAFSHDEAHSACHLECLAGSDGSAYPEARLAAAGCKPSAEQPHSTGKPYMHAIMTDCVCRRHDVGLIFGTSHMQMDHLILTE